MKNHQYLIAQLSTILEKEALFLCTAESCTGGLLGHIITNFSGASAFYLGGQITYSNAAKKNWLGVAEKTLLKHGAVSEATVIAMADGIREAFAEVLPQEKLISLSISGIAGPTGGSKDKPVGTVWIGISMAGLQKAHRCLFKGDRENIKMQSAQKALALLLQELTEK